MTNLTQRLVGCALCAIAAWSLYVCPPSNLRAAPRDATAQRLVESERDGERLGVRRLKDAPAIVRHDPTAHHAIAHLSAAVSMAMMVVGIALALGVRSQEPE